MFRVRWLLKILLQMNERACGLNQTFEKIRIARSCFEPKLLQNIVGFVIALFVPEVKECAIKWMLRDLAPAKIGIFAREFPHQPRNPLAFVHEGLNLVAAQMMGKPRGFTFREGSKRCHIEK